MDRHKKHSLNIRATLELFDSYLLEKGLKLEGVVIGGAALNLTGIIETRTRDCDIISPEIPQNIQDEISKFAMIQREQGTPISDDWINDMPKQIATILEPGWESRTVKAFEGKAICLYALGRFDLLCTKLDAYCGRQVDLPDCVAMSPSKEELDNAFSWVHKQDGNPDWPSHCRTKRIELEAALQQSKEKGDDFEPK